MKKITGILIGLVIAFALAFYFMLPVISFSFLHIPIMLLILSIIAFALSFMGVKSKEDLGRKQKLTGGLVGVIAIYILVSLILSSAIFTWEAKKNQLNLVEVSSFDESVPNVDMKNLVILDESDALRASEKLITEKDPSLGSIYQIGEGTLSVVNQKPYWVFPLEYRGLFKWLSNKGNIPGYLKVSATNFNEAEFVDYKFSVSMSGYMGDDLRRIIYKKFPSYGLTDYSFEVDDEGKGNWVVTAYTNDTFLSTMKVIGTIIVDPVTKDMEFYPTGKQPEWVDRVYSLDTFDKQLDWYGKYINGWWNPSDKGKLEDTNGKGYVFKDGEIYFYTGLTSVGKDGATTGFVIYNPRNGQAEYNRISGSIESKAVGLMEELVQNAGYKANYPYLININGEATYFSTLKGNSGNVVGYAFASVQNYKAVAWGKSLSEAKTEYSRVLLREGSSNSLSSQGLDLIREKGIVSRLGYLKEGYYVLKFVDKDLLFVVNSDQFPEISLTKEGDTVEASYLESNETVRVDAIEFTNESIK